MNKKEIAEIKKQLKPKDAVITRVCGRYADMEGETLAQFKEAFPSLPENEQERYLELFKKCISGTPGKTLFDFGFPLEAEQQEDGFHRLLMELRASGLSDDDLLEEFYGNVLETLDYEGNVLILILHGSYDVPGRVSDGMEMEDASDTSYTYLIAAACPVAQAKPGLSYKEREQEFKDRRLDWVVGMPMAGFLFPAFTDRATDIHSVLFYNKNTKAFQSGMAEGLFASHAPAPADAQKEAFAAMVEEGLGRGCNFTAVKELSEALAMRMEGGDGPTPVSGEDVHALLASQGAEQGSDETQASYEACLGTKEPMAAANLINPKKFEIKTDDAVIQVAASQMDLIGTKMVDGQPCFVIPMNGTVELNGIHIRSEA